MIFILKTGIQIASIKLPKLLIKYSGVFIFNYNIYQAINQKKYNKPKTLALLSILCNIHIWSKLYCSSLANLFLLIFLIHSLLLANMALLRSLSDLVLFFYKITIVDFGQYNIHNICTNYIPVSTQISNPVPTISKMTAIDISRLNLRNKCNNNQ